MLSIIFQSLITVLLVLFLYYKSKLTLGASFLGIANVALLIVVGGNEWTNLFLLVVIASFLVPKLFSGNDKNHKPKEVRNWKDLIAISTATFFCLVINKLNVLEADSIVLYYASLGYILADIFSSEIKLSFWKSPARLISNHFKVVQHGVSGAVSVAGIVYSFVGALMVGLIYLIIHHRDVDFMTIVIVSFLVCFLESVFNDYKHVLKLRYSNELTNTTFVLASIIMSGIYVWFIH